jgi:hypothetical protein
MQREGPLKGERQKAMHKARKALGNDIIEKSQKVL